MNLLQRVRRKSFSEPPFWDLDRLRSPFIGYSTLRTNQERVENDFLGYVEAIYKRNGPAFALMALRLMLFSEARFQFRKLNGGKTGDLFGTTDLAILETPWANATTGDLLARMIQHSDLAGNAYVTKINGHLRILRPDWVTIVSSSKLEPQLYGAALDAEIAGYIYSPQVPGSAQSGTLLLPSQVAHFAPIPDPAFNWRGMSWLTPVLREISSDTAATAHKLKFFENGASLQTVVSLDASVTPEVFKRFKALFDESHRGTHNAYKTLYLGGGADVTVVGADLKSIDFAATQGAGESRLAAAAGVPAAIVGFSEGMKGSSLNAGNYASARRRLADGTLRPLWRNAAGSLATLINVPSGAQLWFDDTDIAFLRDDQAAIAEVQSQQATTINQLVAAGYEPKSVVAAVMAEDFSLLTHTGLYSVQLQPPSAGTNPDDGPQPPIPVPPTPPPALPAGGQ